MRSLLSAAKQGGNSNSNNRSLSGHVITLHQRFYHAFNLGSRENNKGKWRCEDIEIQKLVLRSIEPFLDCISNETLQHSLVKDSVVDIVRALDRILELKSESILRLASVVTLKMVKILPSSMLQSHRVINLISPLSDLIASNQLQVSISCATSLKTILSKLAIRHETVAYDLLNEGKAVGYLVANIKQFCKDNRPIEYLKENASALSKILWRWPSFRYQVWNDSEFLNVLTDAKFVSESSAEVDVLELYSTLALCGNGAEKLLENGQSLLKMMLHFMNKANAHSVRMEAFKLARCLALTEQGCSKMMNICCEPFAKAVFGAIPHCNTFGKQDKGQFILEVCCLVSLVTRWAGDHQSYFWKENWDGCLLQLLLNHYTTKSELLRVSRLEDLICMVRQQLDGDLILYLRPYIWDILGGLVANCRVNIKHEMHREVQLKILIVCLCVSFVDSIAMVHQVSVTLADLNECESASRAILMMISSPCKTISELATSVLGEVLNSRPDSYIDDILLIFKAKVAETKFMPPGDLQVLVSLTSLACFCAFPEHRERAIKHQGFETMVAFIRWLLNNPILVKRASIVPHLQDCYHERLCCFPKSTDEWEGEEAILLFSLWVLADLLCHSTSHFSGLVKRRTTFMDYPFHHLEEFTEAQFIIELQNICQGDHSPGLKWYAAYVLSFFGIYGFPSKLGKKMDKLFGENDYANMKLEFANKDAAYVHELILLVRCQALIPASESLTYEESSSESGGKAMKVFRLNPRVEKEPLMKTLEYIFLGYIQASEEDLVKKLKLFARHCKLEGLRRMLCRKRPDWGAAIPKFDLRPALEPPGVKLSNILLESNTQLEDWKCNNCSASVPHLHVHKVIMESSCDYLRALFWSGMQESNMQAIKVPVSWGSLIKLVSWCYSCELTVLSFDCTWNNLDVDEKCREAVQYLELCWLSEYWVIDHLYEECYNVAVSCLNSSSLLSTKLIQVAANLSLWNLAQIAANCMAPKFHDLRNSGELHALDSNVVGMVRAASVRLLQGHDYEIS